MKNKIRKLLISLLTVCVLLICSACSFDLGEWFDGVFNTPFNNDANNLHFAAYTKYDVGEVEKKGEPQTAKAGEKVTLRAIDTEEYAFSHWERLNKIVSTDREYTFRAEQDLDFHRYYAVFTPKDSTKALVNVLCDNGETLDEDLVRLERLIVSGGGYYSIGDTATLQGSDDGVGIARYFSYDDTIVDGPVLNLPVEKNITVTATLEKMVEITLAENGICELDLQSESRFLPWGDYQVSMEMIDDDYVPDMWLIKDKLTGEVLREHEWEWNITLNEWVSTSELGLHRQLLVELTCTNENLVDTIDVEVVSTTGDPVHIDVEKPAKTIAGRGFPVQVMPDENTYIQDIYIYEEPSEQFPFASRLYFTPVEAVYKDGGQVIVTDPTADFGANCTVILEAIVREKAAVVKLISDDEYVARVREETGRKPNSYYSSSLGTQFLIVEKNKEYLFPFQNDRNLGAIYEVGCQFKHIEDENGRKVADNLKFLFSVSEDTNYYIKWAKKPVDDLYFDYTLTADRTGYVAKLSQLTLFPYLCPSVSEISLPYTYNGLPVKEIADFGMSAYRCHTTILGLKLGHYTRVPFNKIVLPYTLEKIGEKAFASCFDLQVVFPSGDKIVEMSPDAFWSPNDTVYANLSSSHLKLLLKTLHTKYIGVNEGFTYRIMNDSHFGSENDLAHYEALAEYICVKESIIYAGAAISAFELGLLYHEFFHHYQFVAMTGVGEESLESMNIKPTSEQITAWSTPYDTTDYEEYWNHALEVSARDFATEWSGWVFENP